MVALVRGGRTPEKLGKELETSAQTIRNWVKEADPDAWTGTDALTTEEREELRRLRRENRQLKMEREVLTESVAWSAWETGSIPDEHPSS